MASSEVFIKSPKTKNSIDYSMTVNLFTKLDAFPFPDIQDLVNIFFSKIDLKSAYHLVPLNKEDKQFTAFEGGGEVYNFNGLPFWVTNAVPAFLRIIDNLVDLNKLERTYPYLDDEVNGGRFE